MKRYISWVGAAAIIVLVFGTLYVTVQNSERTTANSPQVQLAEDAAVALDNGKSPVSVVSGMVSMNQSLAPFVVIYDKSGNPVSGSGRLDNHLPTVPIGVLTAAKGHDYHAVTWQPQAKLRFATVTVAADKYYVLSGRSLKEVEKTETQALQLSAIGCLGSLLILAIVYAASRTRTRK